MAAVLSDAHGIFAWGWNHPGPEGFGTHAEEHAINRANPRRLRGATVTVAGFRHGAHLSRTRRYVYARPCAERCWDLLLKLGVTRVQFIVNDGQWIEERLRVGVE